MRKVQKHAYILAGVFLLWSVAYSFCKPTGSAGRVVEDFKDIPLQIGDWHGIELEFDEVTKNALKHCALATRDYENEQGYDSNMSIVYGVDLGDFHQPEYCMEGQGWKRTSSRIIKLPSEQPHNVVITTMSNDYQQIVMMYWFAMEGRTTTVLGSHKKDAFISRLKGEELKPSAMVRMITPIIDDVENAEKLTIDLASKLDPYINKIVSKPAVFKDTGGLILEE